MEHQLHGHAVAQHVEQFGEEWAKMVSLATELGIASSDCMPGTRISVQDIASKFGPALRVGQEVGDFSHLGGNPGRQLEFNDLGERKGWTVQLNSPRLSTHHKHPVPTLEQLTTGYSFTLDAQRPLATLYTQERLPDADYCVKDAQIGQFRFAKTGSKKRKRTSSNAPTTTPENQSDTSYRAESHDDVKTIISKSLRKDPEGRNAYRRASLQRALLKGESPREVSLATELLRRFTKFSRTARLPKPEDPEVGGDQLPAGARASSSKDGERRRDDEQSPDDAGHMAGDEAEEADLANSAESKQA